MKNFIARLLEAMALQRWPVKTPAEVKEEKRKAKLASLYPKKKV